MGFYVGMEFAFVGFYDFGEDAEIKYMERGEIVLDDD
jgi:hypothetical protein